MHDPGCAGLRSASLVRSRAPSLPRPSAHHRRVLPLRVQAVPQADWAECPSDAWVVDLARTHRGVRVSIPLGGTTARGGHTDRGVVQATPGDSAKSRRARTLVPSLLLPKLRGRRGTTPIDPRASACGSARALGGRALRVESRQARPTVEVARGAAARCRKAAARAARRGSLPLASSDPVRGSVREYPATPTSIGPPHQRATTPTRFDDQGLASTPRLPGAVGVAWGQCGSSTPCLRPP